MDINRLTRLLTRNCKEMNNMFIFYRRGQGRERFPIFDAKIFNLKGPWGRDVELRNDCEIIVEQLKIYDGSDPMFDQPCGAIFVRPRPAPEDILRHLTES